MHDGHRRYDRDEGHLDVALAGHPQPRLITADGVVRLGRYGTVLGLTATAVDPTSHPFPVGASLVLFTDGVTDRNDQVGDDDGLDELLQAAPRGDAGELAEHIRRQLLQLPVVRHDDTAVLVITRHE